MAPGARRAGGVAAVVLVAMVAALRVMGRRWWCRCGSLTPVSWHVASSHNSQHLLDAYSFSHVQHGLLLFPALSWLARRRWPDAALRAGLVGSLVAEAAWEVLENTPMVIDRYRAATISLDYVGDSVANSLSDVACCGLGALFAARAPLWVTALVFGSIELGLLGTIRDSLLLNVLMLVAPSDAVRAWQGG